MKTRLFSLAGMLIAGAVIGIPSVMAGEANRSLPRHNKR
jgi:hypothetical protein